MAKARVVARGAKCTCNYGLVFVALVLFSLALYGLVNAFALHLLDVNLTAQDQAAKSGFAVLLMWYFAGFLLLMVGKMVKWKAHGNCPVHRIR